MNLDTRASEQGVILPLFAVSALFLIVTFAVYAFDIKLVKDAKAYSENLAQDICAIAVQSMPFSRQAVNLAINQLPDDRNASGEIIINSRTLIKKVRIITPSPTLLYPNSGPALFGSINNPTGNCSICTLEGDVGTPGVLSNYPQALWNYRSRGVNSKSNGQMSCEITAEVRTFFGDIMGSLLEQGSLESRRVFAKAASGTRLRRNKAGASRDFDKPISIVISPHLEIPLSSIASNRFSYIGPQSGSVIDPLTDLSETLSPPALPVSGSVGFAGENSPRELPELPEATIPGPGTRPHMLVKNAVIENADARRQLLLGCKNPLIEARNLALYSLVERLSRSWFTRRRTQILLTGTRGIDSLGSYRPMPPTLIAPIGEDLTNTQFRLPYVNFLTGNFGFNGVNSLLCPFEDAQCDPSISKIDPSYLPSGMSADEMRGFQRMTTDMLRNCLPINNEINGYATAGDRYVDGQNAGFEPPQFSSKSNISVGPYFPGSGGDMWDLFPGTTANERMNAAQTVRILGSIRSCPFDETPLASHGCTTKDYEYRTSEPPSGLQPDILTTVEYLARSSSGFAYKFPGMVAGDTTVWPVSGNLVPNIEDPSNTKERLTILFLHKRLDPNIVDDIETVVEADLLRKYIVIFMPATEIDTRTPVIDDLKEAFSAESGERNILIPLAPPILSQYDEGNPDTSPDAAEFAQYWFELIQGDMSRLTDKLYKELIATSEIVL